VKTNKRNISVTFADEIARSFGNFRRSFTLPEDADSTKVTAEFHDGVLKVHLPTTPIARSKAIEVKVK
jgi:HSP20 family protein